MFPLAAETERGDLVAAAERVVMRGQELAEPHSVRTMAPRSIPRRNEMSDDRLRAVSRTAAKSTWTRTMKFDIGASTWVSAKRSWPAWSRRSATRLPPCEKSSKRDDGVHSARRSSPGQCFRWRHASQSWRSTRGRDDLWPSEHRQAPFGTRKARMRCCAEKEAIMSFGKGALLWVDWHPLTDHPASGVVLALMPEHSSEKTAPHIAGLFFSSTPISAIEGPRRTRGTSPAGVELKQRECSPPKDRERACFDRGMPWVKNGSTTRPL